MVTQKFSIEIHSVEKLFLYYIAKPSIDTRERGYIKYIYTRINDNTVKCLHKNWSNASSKYLMQALRYDELNCLILEVCCDASDRRYLNYKIWKPDIFISRV